MDVVNRTAHPTTEVLELLEFAAAAMGFDPIDLGVIVRPTTRSYAGRAYGWNPRRTEVTGRNLVTIDVGTTFPCDNMMTSVRWLGWSATHADAEDYAARNGGRAVTGYGRDRWNSHFRRHGVEYRHPYGGKKSPLIVKHDWKELIVTVGAHEFQHIVQFRERRKLSEIECERVAAAALSEYRRHTGRTVAPTPDTIFHESSFAVAAKTSATPTDAGLRYRSKNRGTKTTISLYDGNAAGFDGTTYRQHDPNPDLRWAIACENHREMLRLRTMDRAYSEMSRPEAWCQGCLDIVLRKG